MVCRYWSSSGSSISCDDCVMNSESVTSVMTVHKNNCPALLQASATQTQLYINSETIQLNVDSRGLRYECLDTAEYSYPKKVENVLRHATLMNPAVFSLSDSLYLLHWSSLCVHPVSESRSWRLLLSLKLRLHSLQSEQHLFQSLHRTRLLPDAVTMEIAALSLRIKVK